VRVDKTNLVPPPLNLLPPGEERFLGTNLKLLATKSQTSLCKNLSLRETKPHHLQFEQACCLPGKISLQCLHSLPINLTCSTGDICHPGLDPGSHQIRPKGEMLNQVQHDVKKPSQEEPHLSRSVRAGFLEPTGWSFFRKQFTKFKLKCQVLFRYFGIISALVLFRHWLCVILAWGFRP